MSIFELGGLRDHGGGPYLYQVASLLWPGSTLSSRRRDAERGRPGAHFLAVPSRSRPAMLVPASPCRVTASALAGAKTGGTRRQRFILRSMALVARTGALRALPSHVVVLPNSADSSADIVTWLSAALGREVRISLAGSPARSNRKPILQVLGTDGQALGYAKVGTNELTRWLVAREGRALAQLAGSVPEGLRVPRVLACGAWGPHKVLVQEALVPRGPQSWTAADLSRRMVAFAHSGGVQESPVTESRYVILLRERLAELPPSPAKDRLVSAATTLVTRYGTVRLKHGRWHGDWTPWNMARRGADLLLWDLERMDDGVPLGFDELHHHVQCEVVRNHQAAEGAATGMVRTAEGLLGSWQIDPRAARVTALLYLLEIGARYSADRQEDAGGALSGLADWLLPALESAVTRRDEVTS